jgi:hypothetical protein
MVSQEEMDRQVARWHELMADGGPKGEGWASVQVLDRDAAAHASVRFVPAAQTLPQLA